MANHYELIYTSVPRGLRAGSQGFCTVATTSNMPTGLIGPLENLSAYRHMDAAVMPVNYSHERMKVAGRNIDVISRVGDAGVDYTGRTNKIAHHIVVDAADRPQGGPAALLLEGDLTLDTWNLEPGELPPLTSLPQVRTTPRVAQHWADVTGDAGWAGYVASQLVASGATTWLIHRPDQNAALLEMIDEALSILSPAQRWDATFATYCGDVAPGVTIRLRCVLEGSPEAAAATAHSGINLASGSLGSPPGSPYVDAARQGVAVETLLARESVSTTATAAKVGSHAAAPDTHDSFALQPLPPPTAGVRPPHLGGKLPPALTTSPSRKSWGISAAAAALLLMSTVAGGMAWVNSQKRQNEELVQVVQQSENDSGSVKKTPKDHSQIPNEIATSPTIAADDQPMKVEEDAQPEPMTAAPEVDPLKPARTQLTSIENAKELVIQSAKDIQAKLGEMQATHADIQKQMKRLDAEYTRIKEIDVLRNAGDLDELFVKPAATFNTELEKSHELRKHFDSERAIWARDLVALKVQQANFVGKQIREWQKLPHDCRLKVDEADLVSELEKSVKKITVGNDSMLSLPGDADSLSNRFFVNDTNVAKKFLIPDRRVALDAKREAHTLNVYLFFPEHSNSSTLQVEMLCGLTNQELSECRVKLADDEVNPGPGYPIDEDHQAVPGRQLYLVKRNGGLAFVLEPGGSEGEFSSLALEFANAAKRVKLQLDNIRKDITFTANPKIGSDPNATAHQRAPYNILQLIQTMGASLPELNSKQLVRSLELRTDDVIGKVTLEGDSEDSTKHRNASDSEQTFATRVKVELKEIPMQVSVTNTDKPRIRSIAEKVQRYLQHRDQAHDLLMQLMDEKVIDFKRTLVFSRSDSEFSESGTVLKTVDKEFELVFIPKIHYNPPPR